MSNLPASFNLFGRCAGNAERSINLKGISLPVALDVEGLLEWLYKVTNAPAECLNAQDRKILDVLKPALNGKFWCVSVGDCFAINDEIYCCYPCGWTKVAKDNVKAFFAKSDDARWNVLPAAADVQGVFVSRFDTEKVAA